MKPTKRPRTARKPAGDLEATRDRLLEAMLTHVAFDGWSAKALAAGAKDVGLSVDTSALVFPDGLADVADHFADWLDRSMIAELERAGLEEMRIRERIHTCVKTRIRLMARHREAVRRLIAYLALPFNAPLTARLTWRTCSVMWYAAGDRATDWNHYSKRGLLAPVYTTTVLYWLSDEGDGKGDFPETWAYLERRIEDVLRVFGIPRRLSRALERLPRPLRGPGRFRTRT